jgi:hypothetical protein
MLGYPVPLRLKVYCALAAVGLLIAMVGAWVLGDLVTGVAPRLLVEDGRTGQVILIQPVVPGARFTLSYLSAVSRARVVGVFEIAPDGALIARGAGGAWRGFSSPSARREPMDEVIRQRDLSRRVAALTVFVHPHTEHRLDLGSRTLDLSGTLPAGTQVRISVKRP